MFYVTVTVMVVWEDISGRKSNSDRSDDAQQNKINIKRVPKHQTKCARRETGA
jgi:hypothetical protein